MGNSAASRWANVPVVSGTQSPQVQFLARHPFSYGSGERSAQSRRKTTGTPTVTALATTTDANIGGGGAPIRTQCVRMKTSFQPYPFPATM